MKLSIQDIINGHQAMPVLSTIALPFEERRIVRKISNIIGDELKLVVEEENRLLLQYAKKDTGGNPVVSDGRVTFETLADKQKYVNERKDILQTVIDVDIPDFTLSLDIQAQLRISLDEEECLKKIINFEE